MVGTTLLMLSAVAGMACADLTASYDGQFSAAGEPASLAVGALTQTGHALTGTVVLDVSDARLAGIFSVHGRGSATRFRLSGTNSGGAKLLWVGKITATGAEGRARLRSPSGSLKGRLTLTRRTAAGDGSGCDSVFNQNQVFFTDQVMGQVLMPICANCHVSGGLAQAARFRVTSTDPLATARTVSPFVNSATPAASLILNKPLGTLPHGGGQQIAAGSTQEDILTQWVNLIAAADCNGGGVVVGGPPSGGGTGADRFAQNCAGCHGTDAHGQTGPDIHCNKNIHDTVRNGRTGSIGTMPAFAALSDADIASIQEFLNGLCPAGSASGADLFASNCAACHGADALGQLAAPDVRCTVSSRVLNAVRSGRGSVMPVFSNTALPDTDAAKIVDYLAGLCSGTSAERFASNCATCHGATAGGSRNANGVRGPNIRCTEAHDFLEKVRFGSDAMPPFPEFISSDVTAIATYVQTTFCPLGGDD